MTSFSVDCLDIIWISLSVFIISLFQLGKKKIHESLGSFLNFIYLF